MKIFSYLLILLLSQADLTSVSDASSESKNSSQIHAFDPILNAHSHQFSIILPPQDQNYYAENTVAFSLDSDGDKSASAIPFALTLKQVLSFAPNYVNEVYNKSASSVLDYVSRLVNSPPRLP